MYKKKVLIVGGCGYVGGYLTDYLTTTGYDITVYDNLMYETRFLKDVKFIYGDIRDLNKLNKIENPFSKILDLNSNLLRIGPEPALSGLYGLLDQAFAFIKAHGLNPDTGAACHFTDSHSTSPDFSNSLQSVP